MDATPVTNTTPLPYATLVELKVGVHERMDFESTRRRWKRVQFADDGELWFNGRERMTVIWSAALVDDRGWIHASMSLPTRPPTYDELCFLHRVFIGPHRHAAQLWVPADEHVNIHPNCLHLWAPIEGRIIPPMHGTFHDRQERTI